MKIELKKWSIEDKESLIRICNTIDRNYLSDRLPNPYTNESAEWWLNEYSCAAEPPVRCGVSHLSRRNEPLYN